MLYLRVYYLYSRWDGSSVRPALGCVLLGSQSLGDCSPHGLAEGDFSQPRHRCSSLRSSELSDFDLDLIRHVVVCAHALFFRCSASLLGLPSPRTQCPLIVLCTFLPQALVFLVDPSLALQGILGRGGDGVSLLCQGSLWAPQAVSDAPDCSLGHCPRTVGGALIGGSWSSSPSFKNIYLLFICF